MAQAQEDRDVAVGRHRVYTGMMGKVIAVIAVAMSVYHILYLGGVLTAAGLHITGFPHRAIFLFFLTTLIFLLVPGTRKGRAKLPWYDIVLLVAGAVPTAYIFLFYDRVQEVGGTGITSTTELVLGLILTLVILEASRRTIGWAMPVIALFFIFNTLFGNYFPGVLYNRGYNLERFTYQIYIFSTGIFGLPLGIASTIIIVFIMFGQFLQGSGAGKFFIDLAFGLVGRFRGGPAKAAVIGSAFFGSISGSPAANVAGTGVVTIPLMKKTGYKPEFASAVEAVSSTGGVFMPPVMGAVAFLISEFLGIPYVLLILYAAPPAILYYLAEYIQIDLEAARMGIAGLPRAELPSIRRSLIKGWHYLIPPTALIFFLAVLKYSPEKSAMWAIGALVVINLFQGKARMGLRAWLEAFQGTARGMLEAGIACAVSGVIIGAVSLTGLGSRLSYILVDVSGGNLFLLLSLTALTCFILGMGLSSIPIYVMLAVLVGPALVNAGVLPLAAHLFVFYWGTVSFLTPPVCMAAFVAAAIGGAKPMETGWQATRLGIVTFIIPFMFVYSPALLLHGSPAAVGLAMVSGLAGTAALASGVSGFFLTRESWWERLLLMGGALGLMFAQWLTSAIGLALVLPPLLWQLRKRRRYKFKASLVEPALTSPESPSLQK